MPTDAQAIAWVNLTKDYVGIYKVGLQLFTAHGLPLLSALRSAGAEHIFLDLKLHDIPNTVAETVKVVRSFADYLTIHTGGGANMMRAAVEAANGQVALLAVTVLTSLDKQALEELDLCISPKRLALNRAVLATVDCGVPGLICSALELETIRPAVEANTIIGVPGIRLAGGDAGDQKRVATPEQALKDGASFIVLGRAVRDAEDPVAVLKAIHAGA